jgi:hypothetical protein
MFDRFLPLIQFEATSGIGVRKEILRRRGAMKTSVTRRGPPVDTATQTELDDVLRRVRLELSAERVEVGP